MVEASPEAVEEAVAAAAGKPLQVYPVSPGIPATPEIPVFPVYPDIPANPDIPVSPASPSSSAPPLPFVGLPPAPLVSHFQPLTVR